jgi:uncharacterized protein (DUF2147 family)
VVRSTLLLSLLVVLVLLVGAASSASPDAGADGILGTWVTAPDKNGTAHITIERTGERIHGKIVWLSQPSVPADDAGGRGGQPKTDYRNPDPELRGRTILGLPIVDGFRYVGSSEWKQGRIYDPGSGKTYSCQAKLLPDGRLKVRGYLGISLLGRSTIWTRLDPQAGAP